MAEISKMLPGYNCGECGHRQCKDYAEKISIKGDISKCRYLERERFIETKAEIQQFLSTYPFARPMDIVPGDVLRYRALGYPVIHFARVMKYIQGIATAVCSRFIQVS